MTIGEERAVAAVTAIPKRINELNDTLKGIDKSLKELTDILSNKWIRIPWPVPTVSPGTSPEAPSDAPSPYEKAPWWMNPDLPPDQLTCKAGSEKSA